MVHLVSVILLWERCFHCKGRAETEWRAGAAAPSPCLIERKKKEMLAIDAARELGF
jgi:hypothetical protein